MDKLCLEITYSVLILVSLGEPVPVNSPNFPVKDLVIFVYRASLGAIFILLKPEKLKLKFLFGGSLVCGGSLVTQPIYTVFEQFALIGVFFWRYFGVTPPTIDIPSSTSLVESSQTSHHTSS